MKQIRSKSFHVILILICLIAVNLILAVNLRINGAQNETSAMTTMTNAEMTKGVELFIKARKMYNAEAPVNEVKKVLNDSEESFAKLPDGYDKYYWQANVAYLSGEIAEVLGG